MKDLLSQAIALELALSFWRSELINARVLGHKASSFSTADTDPNILQIVYSAAAPPGAGEVPLSLTTPAVQRAMQLAMYHMMSDAP